MAGAIRTFPILFFLTFLLPTISASPLSSLVTSYVGDPLFCLTACTQAISLVSFSDGPSEEHRRAVKCTSDLWLGSIVNCGSTRCTEKDVEHGWKSLTTMCERTSKAEGKDFPTFTQIQNGLPSDLKVVNTLLETGNTYYEVIQLSDEAFQAGHDTEFTWRMEMTVSQLYGIALYTLTAIAVVINLVNRILHFILPQPTLPPRSGPTSYQAPTLRSRIQQSYRKYVSLPALGGHIHAQGLGRGWKKQLVPTRLQWLWIQLYIWVNIAFMVMYYNLFDDNLYWRNDKTTQFVRYVSDRTGIICWWQLPLLWLLASRNDVLLWLFGWNYDTAMVLHAAVAKMATVQALIHSVGYGWLARDHFWRTFSKQYWWMGCISTIAMVLLVLLAAKGLRDKSYEVFLVLHISLAIIVIVTLFYHVNIWAGKPWDPWLWACVIIWISDRAIRVARVLVLSFHGLYNSTNSIGIMNIDEQGLIRLTVETSVTCSPRPGSYYFLYFPRQWNFYENHPFTLASTEQPTEPGGKTRLHFLIVAHKGMTGALARKLRRRGGEMRLNTLLEGPYGHSCPVEEFENVLLVSGGSGVTALLPYLEELQRKASTGSCRTTRVTLLWVVRTRRYAEGVLQHELLNIPRGHLSIKIQLYVTSEASGQPSGVSTPALANTTPVSVYDTLVDEDFIERIRLLEQSKSSSYGSTDTVNILYHDDKIQYRFGRPDMVEVLDESLAEVGKQDHTAVLICGPGKMMDDMRKAVVDAIHPGKSDCPGNRVEYFEEGFVW